MAAPLRAALLCILFMLQACGYQIRSVELDSLGFTSLTLKCDSATAWHLCQKLKRDLVAHNVEITEQAPFTLSVLDISTKERVFTINMDATADEYEITRRIKFELSQNNLKTDKRPNKGSYLNEVSARRIYRHNSDALLAKERERTAIERALDNSLANEIIRQLTLIKVGTKGGEE